MTREDDHLGDAGSTFVPWDGDPFVGEARKHGQIDYDCHQCGNTGRHPYCPDVPKGWWYLHDVASDTVFLVCKPSCAAEYSKLTITREDATVRELVQAVVAAGWRYRSPEKGDPTEFKSTPLGGGWGKGTV